MIVMSTVRCNRHGKLGFVTDPRRLNVAISRPRRYALCHFCVLWCVCWFYYAAWVYTLISQYSLGLYVDVTVQLGELVTVKLSDAPHQLDEHLDWWCRGLVIVGSPETLKANCNWLEWLEWVRSQNAILHSDDLA